MAIGLVGRKCGMTRVFTEDGRSIPVTVIQALPNRITRIKTPDSDGYAAVQVTTGTVKASRVSRPMARSGGMGLVCSLKLLIEFCATKICFSIFERILVLSSGVTGFSVPLFYGYIT